MKTLCVTATGPDRIEVGEHEIREPQAGEVVVAGGRPFHAFPERRFSGVSGREKREEVAAQ